MGERASSTMRRTLPLFLVSAACLRAQAQQIDEYFSDMDTNQDRKVIRSELEGWLKSQHETHSVAEVDNFFQELDVNGNGEITFNEVLQTRYADSDVSEAEEVVEEHDSLEDELETMSQEYHNDASFMGPQAPTPPLKP